MTAITNNSHIINYGDKLRQAIRENDAEAAKDIFTRYASLISAPDLGRAFEEALSFELRDLRQAIKTINGLPFLAFNY